MKHILSIDIGTSSVKAILLNEEGTLKGTENKELTTYHPFRGHQEQDPKEIFRAAVYAIKQLVEREEIRYGEIQCIGISNARETTVVWDKTTGKPAWNAILWSDNRSRDFCVKNKELGALVKEKTGLSLTSYGSATKIRWILDNAEIKNVDDYIFGTLNTWLLWKLTGGKEFTTDITNASRTLLFNLDKSDWDEELLDKFNIKRSMLPEVKSCSEEYGVTDQTLFGAKIPICSMIGDAQAALFASGCHKNREVHCSFGTGAFLLMNTENHINRESKALTTTVAYQIKGEPVKYCVESSVLAAGSAVSWMKTHLGMIRSAKEIEGLAYSVPDSGGVYFVPAITGLLSPYTSEHVGGSLLGLTASTNIGHICRALIEGISCMISDAWELFGGESKDVPCPIKCSGGMAENNFLLQMVSGLTEEKLIRSKNLELSSFGAAYLAGIACGIWNSEEEIRSLFEKERIFTPEIEPKDLAVIRRDWKKAIAATCLFSDIKIA